MKIESKNLKDVLTELSNNYAEDFERITRELELFAKSGYRETVFTNLSQNTIDRLTHEGLSVTTVDSDGITYYYVKW